MVFELHIHAKSYCVITLRAGSRDIWAIAATPSCSSAATAQNNHPAVYAARLRRRNPAGRRFAVGTDRAWLNCLDLGRKMHALDRRARIGAARVRIPDLRGKEFEEAIGGGRLSSKTSSSGFANAHGQSSRRGIDAGR
jgi:hypothetical protein